jgi:hypothetical protein
LNLNLNGSFKFKFHSIQSNNLKATQIRSNNEFNKVDFNKSKRLQIYTLTMLSLVQFWLDLLGIWGRRDYPCI